MFMSIFSLKEKGADNFPAKIVNNPEGGIIALPYFGGFVKNMLPKGQREKSAGWGLGGPSVVVNNPQVGKIFYPYFSDQAQLLLKNQEKAAPKPPASPKPKSVKPQKGKPVHKKLHANPHPILAEATRMFNMSFKHSEADSLGTAPSIMTVGGVKRESRFKILSSKFKEAVVLKSQDLPTKFRVVLLEEGMGNSTDTYYYDRGALESAVDIFTGLKIMADHPSAEEKEIRPERSTRDILGHYENLGVEISESGQAQLCGDVDILPSDDCEWARARMVRAIENAKKFPGRDFIGLSINASGPSEEVQIDEIIKICPDGAKQKLVDAKAEGIDTVKLVKKISRAVSCDLVTEAGAGGKILNTIAGGDPNEDEK